VSRLGWTIKFGMVHPADNARDHLRLVAYVRNRELDF
jgi:hypothetical protein